MKAKIKATGEIITLVNRTRANEQGVLGGFYWVDEQGAKYPTSELDFLPDKETAVMEGWLTRSKSGELILSDSPECKRGGCVWYHKEGSNVISMSELGFFSNDIFLSVTWQSEPKRVRIKIQEIEE